MVIPSTVGSGSQRLWRQRIFADTACTFLLPKAVLQHLDSAGGFAILCIYGG